MSGPLIKPIEKIHFKVNSGGSTSPKVQRATVKEYGQRGGTIEILCPESGQGMQLRLYKNNNNKDCVRIETFKGVSRSNCTELRHVFEGEIYQTVESFFVANNEEAIAYQENPEEEDNEYTEDEEQYNEEDESSNND